MGLDIRPLTKTFGAEIRGLDLAQSFDAATQGAVRGAFLEHGILLFRGQALTPPQHVAFTRGFGDLEIHVQTGYLLPGHPEIFVLSNIKQDGRLIGGVDCALSWHSDSSYLAVPSLGSALYAIQAPPVGADTWFAGMTAAYAALPEAKRRQIDPLRAVHSYLKLQQEQFPERPLTEEQRRKTPPVEHPVVRVHPETGRRSLFLGGSVIASVSGMPADDGIGLMHELLRFATGGDFTYCHRWQAGDVVMWDNRCTVHRGTKYDTVNHRRRMHRTTLAGTERPRGVA
jgi:taurine dioxygenase